MNKYEKEALADIQSATDQKMVDLGRTVGKLVDAAMLPLGKRPRLSRRIRSGMGMYRTTDAARRLYEAMCALKAIPSTEDTDEVIAELEDRAAAALFELVEATR